MANYYEYSRLDVPDPEAVGVGKGDAPDGSPRICVSLEGLVINRGLDPSWKSVNWTALTLPAAQHLRDLLDLALRGM
jgi:hypothetical protein